MADIVSGNNQYLRWPPVATLQEVDTEADSIYARSFGASIVDLDIDFGQPKRPSLISQLLMACCRRTYGADLIENDVWQWSLKKRLQAMSAIVVATLGQHVKMPVQCLQPSCQELLEIDLDLIDFCDTNATGSLSFQPCDNTKLQLRLPTGHDQLHHLAQGNPETGGWEIEMATSLVTHVNGQIPASDWILPRKWLEGLGTTLERYDSLMTLKICTSCPACNKDIELDIDLESRLLDLLAGAQRHLYNQVHCLASHYHWTENDIMSLSPRHRNYYLACIGEGLDL